MLAYDKAKPLQMPADTFSWKAHEDYKASEVAAAKASKAMRDLAPRGTKGLNRAERQAVRDQAQRALIFAQQ
jgi:hypothetical protein